MRLVDVQPVETCQHDLIPYVYSFSYLFLGNVFSEVQIADIELYMLLGLYKELPMSDL